MKAPGSTRTRKVVLAWRSFPNLTEARSAFAEASCIYVQTDRRSAPIRIGKASKGLETRYRGGTGYALDAAMHESGNKVFAAKVPASQCDEVERALIWRFRHSLPYNNQGKRQQPTETVSIAHRGTVPDFPKRVASPMVDVDP